ncbi:hypothetical protein TREMEDRAFT_73417 [Tremella mesenterica DSM 1558]|uniref:uncharacterized protein n=1 Tax=Tremella mesenterica (strain ATCC 24925 / CBS 8224 / DSM 1558 / NBRC 9311 / NRRL Y-6157 / RJB 2259-6 / UBC 559-6) TaxID=578456 RepID=UPI0003F4A40C|nr:uncharacterized protein TREMEDRAFT_73417 [Tremella mesenterica DSM 1558]EIW71837.1 hypothetical protein TREMEDRAFT_73417 [Tremella mesenterica DSM 1558]
MYPSTSFSTRLTPFSPSPDHVVSPPHSPRSLPTFIRRISILLSIIIGASALVGLTWNRLFLPLLHATFSARQVLTDQQLSRWEIISSKIKEIRSRKFYGLEVSDDTGSSNPPKGMKESMKDGRLVDENVQNVLEEERNATLKKDMNENNQDDHINGDISLNIDENQQIPRDDIIQKNEDRQNEHVPKPIHIKKPNLMLCEEKTFMKLINTFENLSTTLEITQTTRISLLSTLENFTSSLHREMFLKVNPSLSTNFNVKSNPSSKSSFKTNPTLLSKDWLGNKNDLLNDSSGILPYTSSVKSSSSAKMTSIGMQEGGMGLGLGLGTGVGLGMGSGMGMGMGLEDKNEDWDKVRKEIRAVKGLLLGRRNFGT